MKRRKISWRGRISLPVEILQRWNTRDVMVVDRGDHLIFCPVPEDPIEAALGAFKDHPGPSIDEARTLYREEEREAEERKFGPDPQSRKEVGCRLRNLGS
jgi:bifunctional DNA-binding transcriptional regulator/antitoxin component of YhaV-PrlF toxin-antitoxin module